MTISGATRMLLDRYDGDPEAVTWQWESMVAGVVLRYGSGSDVQALLPVFLADPEARARLVPVFARHGDHAVAERLMEACLASGSLRDGMPTDVLHALGYLGYEPAERILWEHVSRPSADYHESRDACLGLLHLPCRDLRGEITAALERCLGDSFFPEFLPALATKTGDPAWLGRLVAWGAGAASTDCNGGLILGIALHGDTARAAFTRLLWNPRWEACGGGTGSDRWAYAGTCVQGLGLAELYAELSRWPQSDSTPGESRHRLATFTALLRHRTYRQWLGVCRTPEPVESAGALCDLLFESSFSRVKDSLTDFAEDMLDRDDPLIAELRSVEAVLRSEARYELELRELGGGRSR